MSPVKEEQPTVMFLEDATRVEVPVDMSGPNPNDTEFDSLYLDMNGIVSLPLLFRRTAHTISQGTSLYASGGQGGSYCHCVR